MQESLVYNLFVLPFIDLKQQFKEHALWVGWLPENTV